MNKLLRKLIKWCERKPIVLAAFDRKFSHQILESKNGLYRFTLARNHDDLDGIKSPAFCLAEFYDGRGKRSLHLGVVLSKTPIATFQSRLVLAYFEELSILSLSDFSKTAKTARLRKAMEEPDLANGKFISLTPALSEEALTIIAERDLELLGRLAEQLPKLHAASDPEWQQKDAIRLAAAAFGLDGSEFMRQNHGGARGAAEQYLEDYVIWQDATVIPGFEMIRSSLTGHRIFTKSDERMEIFTANKGPLELMLGVDLIYLNDTSGSIVMVQYKMLEQEESEDGTKQWIFRPDSQFNKELARMKLSGLSAVPADYRLNRDPFYFKFVKRKADSESISSFVISGAHLTQFLASVGGKGPKGGKRLGYHSLNGTYLRENDFIGLIRSGYIGTHKQDTENLRVLLEEASKGNRALVLAWQHKHQGVREDD